MAPIHVYSLDQGLAIKLMLLITDIMERLKGKRQ
jgi:hypothetical protein